MSIDNVKFSELITKGQFFSFNPFYSYRPWRESYYAFKEEYKMSTCFNRKYLRWYADLNVNSKSKKGHNSVKMLHTVTFSCLHVGVIMVNKCAKKQSHMSMDFENIWGITKTLT
jgi:hypothetical protein